MTPTQVITKAVVKPVVKEPKVVTKISKPAAKASVKPTTKAPAKVVAKAPVKPVAKAVTKPAAKAAKPAVKAKQRA